MATLRRCLVAGAALALAEAQAASQEAVAGAALDVETISAVYNCSAQGNDAGTLIDYKFLAYCTPALQDSPVAARVVLVVLLGLLLYLLSSTADSFFCPVLQVSGWCLLPLGKRCRPAADALPLRTQAIVEKYRIPPDLAGVTFLTFGNGSPDVFSNIAAFASSSPSIGVTAILGGGLLVTTGTFQIGSNSEWRAHETSALITVIVACVGLVSEGQEQLIPRKFTRDVIFYLVSVVYLCVVFFDGVVSNIITCCLLAQELTCSLSFLGSLA